MKNYTKKIKRGFTLVEMMISVFIFLLLMIAIVQIFAQQIKAYRHARSVQNDMENAQFAMNYVAKTLRTATVLDDTSADDLLERVQFQDNDFALQEVGELGGPYEGLILYDFSQEQCIKLIFKEPEGRYDAHALWVVHADEVFFNDIEQCRDPGKYVTSNERRLTTGDVKGGFNVAPTRYQNHEGSRRTDTIGRVVMTMQVEPHPKKLQRGVDPKPVNMQTTVSLRDYPPDLSF